jgi:radical SAM protein with 4Fe4S-binding SPASM domain
MISSRRYGPLSVLERRLRTAARLWRSGGWRGVIGYVSGRYKYPFLRAAIRLRPGRTPLRRASVVQFEVSSQCNLRCPSCSLSREVAPARHLSRADFNRLFDRLGFIPNSVSLNGIGEPLINPEFFGIVDDLGRRGVQCSFYTNGTLLNDVASGRLLARPNIQFVGISCDGASREVFERLRYGARFDVWKRNVSGFVAAARTRPSGRIQVVLNSVLSRENVHELKGLVALAAELGIETLRLSQLVPNDPVSAEMALDPAAQASIDTLALAAYGAGLGVDVGFSHESRRPRPFLNCLQPWEYVQVSVEGDLLPCCAIVGSDKASVMGNLHEAGFETLWNGPRYAEFRDTAARGTNPLCNACPYY